MARRKEALADTEYLKLERVSRCVAGHQRYSLDIQTCLVLTAQQSLIKQRAGLAVQRPDIPALGDSLVGVPTAGG